MYQICSSSINDHTIILKMQNKVSALLAIDEEISKLELELCMIDNKTPITIGVFGKSGPKIQRFKDIMTALITDLSLTEVSEGDVSKFTSDFIHNDVYVGKPDYVYKFTYQSKHVYAFYYIAAATGRDYFSVASYASQVKLSEAYKLQTLMDKDNNVAKSAIRTKIESS